MCLGLQVLAPEWRVDASSNGEGIIVSSGRGCGTDRPLNYCMTVRWSWILQKSIPPWGKNTVLNGQGVVVCVFSHPEAH